MRARTEPGAGHAFDRQDSLLRVLSRCRRAHRPPAPRSRAQRRERGRHHPAVNRACAPTMLDRHVDTKQERGRTSAKTRHQGRAMLTKKQLDLLEFINKRVAARRRPPSFRRDEGSARSALEIGHPPADHGAGGARLHPPLPHRARALEIVKLPERTLASSGFVPEVIEGDRPIAAPPRRAVSGGGTIELPLMGRIAAGVPIEAIETTRPTSRCRGQMVAAGPALRSRGQGRLDDRRGHQRWRCRRDPRNGPAEEGDIVVAQVEGYEATLKRFRRNGEIGGARGGQPRLRAAPARGRR